MCVFIVCSYIRHHEDVVGVVAPEVIPVLVIPAAENQLMMGAAAVVDGRQVVTYRAQVRELHVALADALTSARQRLQPALHGFAQAHTRHQSVQRRS